MKEGVNLAANWQKHDPLPLLMELVAQPTYGEELGVEEPAIRVIAERFDRLGIPYVLREEKGRAFNLTAEVGESGPSLILNSHLDVVPPGDPDRWEHAPFEPTLVGDKLYGRGSCDAKGSAAAMVAAFERLHAQKEQLPGKVILSLVGAEEIGGLGILHEVEMGLKADAAIVGEPTQLTPHVGHKGRMVIEVTTRGRPAHSSDPDAGINAISKMAYLIARFDELHRELQKLHHPLLGNASSAVTLIRGGVAVNVVPGECVLQLDRRLLPGETPEGAIKAYERILEEARAADSQFDGKVEVLQAKAPAETPPNTRLPEVLTQATAEVLGGPVEVAGFPATCDMTHLANEGGIPTVIFGPGDLALAHQYDEFIPVEELYLAAEVYYRTCLDWMGVKEPLI